MKNLRLNVYISHAGYCSRRRADELIKAGEITINHGIKKESAYLVQEKDTVRHKKQVIKLSSIALTYVVLNKPIGAITTASDDKNRVTVIDLLGPKLKSRVFPIGRLDLKTTGALLLTNDGELAHKLAHPKFKVKKIYQVTLAKDLTYEHFQKIKNGLFLKDGPLKVDDISRAMQKNKVRVTLHSGKNRIVRRIFESQGYTVRKLTRLNFAGITTRGLKSGQWRHLTKTEIKKLTSL